MLELKVWKNQKEVDRVLECEQYDLMLGTLEDVLKLFKVGDIGSEIGKLDQKTMLSVMTKEYDKITVLLHDVFPDLTEAERKRIKAKDLIPFFMNLIAFAIGQITNINTGKN